MKSKQSATKFHFGDGKIYTSIENMLIPAEIGGLKVNIETDVVPCDLPLLLSKYSMQKANTKLDFENNKATMFGREIDLTFTTSGHYCIPLGRLSNAMQSKDDESSNLKVVLLNSSKLDSSLSVDKKKIAVKLHKQFSHPRSNKLHKLLGDRDIKDRELFNLIEKVEADCVIGRQYKRPMPKPIVTFSLAKEFNESVAMDIKYHSSKIVLHLIDHATCFSTRQSNPHIFRNGDSVYYKRESSNQWKGSGSVIGIENQAVMIKHGGSYVKVHPCHVIIENSEFQGKQSANYKEIDTSEETKSKQDSFEMNDSDQIDENDMLNSNKSVAELVTSGSHHSSSEAEINKEDGTVDSARNYQSPVGDTENVIQNQTFSPATLPKMKSTVKFKSAGDGNWKVVKILSRAGKVSDKYKRFLNIEDVETKETDCLDWTEVEEWIPVNTETVLLTRTKLNDLNVEKAKMNELRKWKEHESYQEVEDEGQPPVSTRWVCTEKDSEKGKIVKARLVARGFEEDNSNIRRDSPTCCKESLRLALIVIASNHWEVNSLDSQSAFLQGSRISRDLFIKPPPEAYIANIWKLQDCLWSC